jgi:hypothetical protein
MPGRQDKLTGFRVVAANQVIIVGEDGGVNFGRDIRDKMGDLDVPHPPSRGLILKWDGTTWTRITHARGDSGDVLTSLTIVRQAKPGKGGSM